MVQEPWEIVIWDLKRFCPSTLKIANWRIFMFSRLIFIGYDFSRHLSKKNINAFAASTAFFLFLSLIPALMLLCAIIPYTPLTEGNLLSGIAQVFPDSMDPLMFSIITDVYDKSIGIISVTAIGTLWSAGKGVLALMRGLNAINNVEETRNYVILRVAASIYTVLTLIAIILSLFIMVFGNTLIGIIEGIFHGHLIYSKYFYISERPLSGW